MKKWCVHDRYPPIFSLLLPYPIVPDVPVHGGREVCCKCFYHVACVVCDIGWLIYLIDLEGSMHPFKDIADVCTGMPHQKLLAS